MSDVRLGTKNRTLSTLPGTVATSVVIPGIGLWCAFDAWRAGRVGSGVFSGCRRVVFLDYDSLLSMQQAPQQPLQRRGAVRRSHPADPPPSRAQVLSRVAPAVVSAFCVWRALIQGTEENRVPFPARNPTRGTQLLGGREACTTTHVTPAPHTNNTVVCTLSHCVQGHPVI